MNSHPLQPQLQVRNIDTHMCKVSVTHNHACIHAHARMPIYYVIAGVDHSIFPLRIGQTARGTSY